MAPEIAVVVPTYRRPDFLRRLLDALAVQTLEPSRWGLVVVDNASHDPAVDEVLSQLPDLVPCATRMLQIETNRGPAAARNLGWHSTTAPLVAFLDDDVVPEPAWLEAGSAAFDDPAVGVVQGRTRPPDGVDVARLPAWSIFRQIEGASPFFEACNIFYRRAALEKTSGFDEAMGWWGEDTSLGWQVLDAAWKRSYAPGAVVVHDVEVRGPRWFLVNGWNQRNVVELAARHPGFRQEAFWRPWAFRRREALFFLAAVSAVAAQRWRPAAFGVVPYLLWGRPSLRQRHFVRRCLQTVTVDAACTAGHIAGAVRAGIVVI